MGETADQIERQIQATRNNLNENLGELEDRFKSAVDWRAQVSDRPGTMLALAFGGGILLSALLPASTRKASHEGREPAPTYDREPVKSSSGTYGVQDSRANEAIDNLGALKGALIGIAITKASAFIDELLPGFQQEFARAKGNDSGSPEFSSPPTPTQQKSSAAGAD